MAAIRFGGYQINAQVGEGASGAVFRATRRRAPGGEVALKRLRPELCRDRGFIAALLYEATICAALDHPGIVRVHGLEKARGEYFLTMEYVDGLSLKELLARLARAGRTLPPRLACGIVAQVARALAYAHGRRDQDGRPAGVVHRDVNPSNIMITRAGDAKLLDFGIALGAAHLPRKGVMTGTGLVKGTLGYLSPEQADGGPLDGRSDLFSLGVVLYECLTGQPLFDTRRPLESLRLLSAAEFAPPSRLQGAWPAEAGAAIDAITRALLARRPEDRFADGAAVADALAAVADSLPGDAADWAEIFALPPASTAEGERAGTRRLAVRTRPRPLALLAAAAAVAAIAGGVWVLGSWRAPLVATPGARESGPHAAGLAHLRVGDFRAARVALEAVVAAHPDHVPAQLALVRALHGLGQARRAQAVVRAAARTTDLAPAHRLEVEALDHLVNWRWAQAEATFARRFAAAPADLEAGLALVNLQQRAGKSDGARDTLKALRALPPPLGDDPRIELAEATYTGGTFEQRLAAARRAQDRARARGADLLLASAERLEAIAYRREGQSLKVIEIATRVRARFAAAERWPDVGDLDALIAVCHLRLGDRVAALRAVDRGLASSEKYDDPRHACGVLCNNALTLLKLDQRARGRALYERAVLAARERRDHCHAADVQRKLARDDADHGDLPAALARMEAVVAEQRQHCPEQLPQGIATAADFLTRAGDPRAADTLSAEGLALARKGQAPELLVKALVRRAAIQRRLDRLQAARALLEEARVVADRAGLVTQIGWLESDLARLALSAGDLASAEARGRAAVAAATVPGRADRTLEASAQEALADAALERGDVARAEAALAAAAASLPRHPTLHRRIAREILLARLEAARGQRHKARQRLAGARREAERGGVVALALEARLASLLVGPRSAHEVRQLQELALRHGFALIARRAGQLARATV